MLILMKSRGNNWLSATFYVLPSLPFLLSFPPFFFLLTKTLGLGKSSRVRQGFPNMKSHELLRIFSCPLFFPLSYATFYEAFYFMDPFVKLSMYPAYVLFFLFFSTSCVHKSAALVAWEVNRLQLVLCSSKMCVVWNFWKYYSCNLNEYYAHSFSLQHKNNTAV